MRHPHRSAALALPTVFGLAAALSGMAAGCAAPEPVTELIVRQEPVAQDAPAAARVLTARAASVDVPTHSLYQSADSKNTAQLDVARSLPPNAQGQWTVRRLPIKRGEPVTKQLAEVTLQLDASGRVDLIKSVDTADGVFTIFDPPMVFLPPELVPGQTFVSTFHMVVHPINSPTEVQSEGDATNTVEYLGAETISTPAGSFETSKVRSTLRAKIGQADVENVTETWLAPRAGIVAETRKQRVIAMGLQVRSSAESWVLAPAAPQ